MAYHFKRTIIKPGGQILGQTGNTEGLSGPPEPKEFSMKRVAPPPYESTAESIVREEREPDPKFVEAIVRAIGRAAKQGVFPIPLPIRDMPPTESIMTIHSDIPIANSIQVDSGPKNRVSFYCQNIGVPSPLAPAAPTTVWLGFDRDVRVGYGQPLDPPSGVRVWDGTIFAMRADPTTEFWAIAGNTNTVLVVIERIIAG